MEKEEQDDLAFGLWVEAMKRKVETKYSNYEYVDGQKKRRRKQTNITPKKKKRKKR